MNLKPIATILFSTLLCLFAGTASGIVENESRFRTTLSMQDRFSSASAK